MCYRDPITSPRHQHVTEKTGGRAASITKHLSNDGLRSDIGLKHRLMDDLKRPGMEEARMMFTVTQKMDNWLGWGLGTNFK